MLAVAVLPLSEAVMLAVVGDVTCPGWKLSEKSACPAGTVMLAGSGAAFGSLVVSVTTAPPAGAGRSICRYRYTCGSPL